MGKSRADIVVRLRTNQSSSVTDSVFCCWAEQRAHSQLLIRHRTKAPLFFLGWGFAQCAQPVPWTIAAVEDHEGLSTVLGEHWCVWEWMYLISYGKSLRSIVVMLVRSCGHDFKPKLLVAFFASADWAYRLQKKKPKKNLWLLLLTHRNIIPVLHVQALIS